MPLFPVKGSGTQKTRKGGATKARLAKGARVLRLADARGREIPHMRKPTAPQERGGKKKPRLAPFGMTVRGAAQG